MNEAIMMLLSAIGGGLFCTASISLIAGQKIAKIDQHEERLIWFGTHYVSKEYLIGLQETLEARVDGWHENRELRDANHSKEHNQILMQSEAMQEQLLIFVAENEERWKMINDCLIQIQKNQEC